MNRSKYNVVVLILVIYALLAASGLAWAATLDLLDGAGPPGAVAALSLSLTEPGSPPAITTLVLRLRVDIPGAAFLAAEPEAALTLAGKQMQFTTKADAITIVVFGGKTLLDEGPLVRLLVVIPLNSPVGGKITLLDQGSDASDGQAKPVLLNVLSGEITVSAPSQPHSADYNGDWRISLSELLRLVQFYNSAGLHCTTGTEDGYAPGPGGQTCAPHNADYRPQDWVVSLSELLRLIQFFNAPYGTYMVQSGTEDGFDLGPFVLAR